MFNVYIKRAAEIYGVTCTRPIYEKAIEVLPDEQSMSNTTDEELGEMTKTTNPDAIDIDDFSSDDDENIEELEVQKQSVPSEVFGSLANEED